MAKRTPVRSVQPGTPRPCDCRPGLCLACVPSIVLSCTRRRQRGPGGAVPWRSWYPRPPPPVRDLAKLLALCPRAHVSGEVGSLLHADLFLCGSLSRPERLRGPESVPLRVRGSAALPRTRLLRARPAWPPLPGSSPRPALLPPPSKGSPRSLSTSWEPPPPAPRPLGRPDPPSSPNSRSVNAHITAPRDGAWPARGPLPGLVTTGSLRLLRASEERDPAVSRLRSPTLCSAGP